MTTFALLPIPAVSRFACAARLRSLRSLLVLILPALFLLTGCDAAVAPQAEEDLLSDVRWKTTPTTLPDSVQGVWSQKTMRFGAKTVETLIIQKDQFQVWRHDGQCYMRQTLPLIGVMNGIYVFNDQGYPLYTTFEVRRDLLRALMYADEALTEPVQLGGVYDAATFDVKAAKTDLCYP